MHSSKNGYEAGACRMAATRCSDNGLPPGGRPVTGPGKPAAECRSGNAQGQGRALPPETCSKARRNTPAAGDVIVLPGRSLRLPAAVRPDEAMALELLKPLSSMARDGETQSGCRTSSRREDKWSSR